MENIFLLNRLSGIECPCCGEIVRFYLHKSCHVTLKFKVPGGDFSDGVLICDKCYNAQKKEYNTLKQSKRGKKCQKFLQSVC